MFPWATAFVPGGQTHLISVQRSDGVFLLEAEWLFEELYHALDRAE
jgi:hypothetical protein